MRQTPRTFVTPNIKLATLVNENPVLLLLMEYFEIYEPIADKTVEQICRENSINQEVLLIIANLYNGFRPDKSEIKLEKLDVSAIIRFLKNSHHFYKHDKYPEIQHNIKLLYQRQNTTGVKRIETFFNDYFNEVLEHLRYEDEVAFPYFCFLLDPEIKENSKPFSVNEYREHHSDIETKLTDLKNLLLKYISLKKAFTLKRKMLASLFELESDLYIHSMIEELILLPLVEEIEREKFNGKKSEYSHVEERALPEDVALSNRETEVLALVTRGFSNKSIAKKLFISIHTVITHRKNITDKIGIKSLPGLTLFAISRGILSIDEPLE